MNSLFNALGVLFPSAPTVTPAPAPGPCRYSVRTTFAQTPAETSADDSSVFKRACEASAAFQQLAAVAAGTSPVVPRNGTPATPTPPCLQAPFWATVTCSRRITAADHWQVVQHIEFDISASGMTYRPGDLLTTLPRITEATGRKFLKRIGVAEGERQHHPPRHAVLSVLCCANRTCAPSLYAVVVCL